MRNGRGFTLIEVVVVTAIVGILLALGLSSYGQYISNARVRAAAQTFLAGLQNARSEAVRRNANVDFVLTDAVLTDTSSAADIGSAAATASGTDFTGANWLVRTTGVTPAMIEFKLGAEGSGRSQGEASPVLVLGGAGMITFNGLGVTTAGAAVTYQFSNPNAGNCISDATPGPVRCLNVVVSPGGQARLCDPAVTAAQTLAGDTRGCS